LQGFGHGQYSNVGMPDDDYASAGARGVAARLWASAGVGPGDVDVAQVYDHFTGLVLLSLEDFGFCARGEGGPYAASGALAWPNGALPTNTHGGSLSEAYIHGLNHVVEGVRQLRGESTCQIEGAETCLVTSAAGVPTSALVLGRP
jgi:acetyl-CoA acetyltransferase